MSISNRHPDERGGRARARTQPETRPVPLLERRVTDLARRVFAELLRAVVGRAQRRSTDASHSLHWLSVNAHGDSGDHLPATSEAYMMSAAVRSG